MISKKELSKKLKLYAVLNDTDGFHKIIKNKDVSCVQIRFKNKPFFDISRRINRFVKNIKARSLVIIDDRPDVAIRVNADGVHVGNGDMKISDVRRILGKKYIIGKTVRSLKKAILAQKQGADYISVGPIFKTPYKKLKPLGPSILKRIVKAVSIPVVGIGGINKKNMNTVLETGVCGVCMIRGLK